MINNILFSKDKAQKLNIKAANIDKRLFIIANYSPVEEYTSPEAGFILACLNLFKCTVDGMPIWKALLTKNVFTRNLDTQQKQTLQKINSYQAFLRSIYAHNNCYENGIIQANRIDAYEQWIASNCNGEGLSSENGCQLALDSMLILGEELFNTMDAFLNYIQTLPSGIVSCIVDAIIKENAVWMCKNTHLEIYKARLISQILSNSTINANDEEALQSAEITLIENLYKSRCTDRCAEEYKAIFKAAIKKLEVNKAGDNSQAIKDQIIKEFQDDVNNLELMRLNHFQELETCSPEVLLQKWEASLSQELISCADNITMMTPHDWVDCLVAHNFSRLPLEPIKFSKLPRSS